MRDRSEVKGLWFATARRYATESFGALALEEIAATMRPEHAPILVSPIASEWYPEDALADALAGMRVVLAGGENARFERVMHDATLVGVSTFITSMLGLANPEFVLRRVPVLWRHLRRGTAVVSVDSEPGRVVVRYSQFPWFDDENYVLLTKGALQALVTICKRIPKTRVLAVGRSHCDVEVTWSGRSTLPP